MKPTGYKRKSKTELLKAVDNCKSISQLFALVQHEQINMRMQTLPGASNIPAKKIECQPVPDSSPLDRLKAAVRATVEATK